MTDAPGMSAADKVSPPPPAEDEVLFELRGSAGFITLNRPRALNALTHGMVRAIEARLRAWETDPRVAHVVIQAAGDRAFCAGGDIRVVWEMGQVEGGRGSAEQLAFFAEEYRLNAYIKRYPKPYVSLIDGICMGGGVGLSVHGRYRVGGEKTTFAMPETGIGFFPDVGGSYFLPRMPFETGTYCALAGARLKQADALWTGVLTHAVPSASFPALARALEDATDVAQAISAFTMPVEPAPLEPLAETVEATFSGTTVAGILERLDAVTGAHAEWARDTAATIRGRSPTSVEVTLREVRLGAGLEFDPAMQLEFRIVSHILTGHDFYEGVRAVIIDKDGQPKWQPAALADVEMVDVEAHFMAPQGGDLEMDG